MSPYSCNPDHQPNVRICHNDVPASRGSSLQVDGYFVVRDPLVPPAEGLPCDLLDDGLLVIVSGKPRPASRLANQVIEVNMTSPPSSRRSRRAPRKPPTVCRCSLKLCRGTASGWPTAGIANSIRICRVRRAGLGQNSWSASPISRSSVPASISSSKMSYETPAGVKPTTNMRRPQTSAQMG
jgi:hypothetical protein